jgi:hypothetical protein
MNPAGKSAKGITPARFCLPQLIGIFSSTGVNSAKKNLACQG